MSMLRDESKDDETHHSDHGVAARGCQETIGEDNEQRNQDGEGRAYH